MQVDREGRVRETSLSRSLDFAGEASIPIRGTTA